MQQRYYEDRYPIGRFVLDRARTLGLSRTELVRRLGFRDLAKAHWELSRLLLTGTVPPHLTELASALEVDASLLDAIILATTNQQSAEWQRKNLGEEEAYRAGFHPHLQVQTERSVPSPIFVAALLTVERLRILRLPDEIIFAEQDECDQIIQETINAHYHERAGQVPAFGRITGYIFVRIAGYGGTDYGVQYDRYGSPVGSTVKVRRLPQATLGIKNGDTRLTGLLKETPVQVVRPEPDE